MNEEKKVSKLRFPGFDDEWEQRKVQDIYKITRGYVLAAPETESDKMPYPVYSSQTKNNGLMGYYKDFLYENAITWTTDGANHRMKNWNLWRISYNGITNSTAKRCYEILPMHRRCKSIS